MDIYLQQTQEVLTSLQSLCNTDSKVLSTSLFLSSPQPLPVASHVALWPAIHVRGSLESSVSLTLLQHWGLCVGHAGRKQGALWCARASKVCVCLLVYTYDGRSRTGQPHWTCRLKFQINLLRGGV